MASYKMLVKDVIKQADVLLEIVDARFPDETRNSAVENEISRFNKPFIIVLNKCDLISKEKLEKTKSRFSKIAPTVFVSGKASRVRIPLLFRANRLRKKLRSDATFYPTILMDKIRRHHLLFCPRRFFALAVVCAQPEYGESSSYWNACYAGLYEG